MKLIKALVILTALSFGAMFSEEQKPCPETLFKPVSEGNLAGVEAAINSGISVKCYGSSDSLIHSALGFQPKSNPDRLKILRLLIDAGVNVNEGEQSRPIYLALTNKNVGATKMLIDSGADLNRRCFSNRTPLMVAADNGFIEGVKLILAAKVDVNATDFSYDVPPGEKPMTALGYATRSRNREIIKLLKIAGGKLTGKEKNPAVAAESESTPSQSQNTMISESHSQKTQPKQLTGKCRGFFRSLSKAFTAAGYSYCGRGKSSLEETCRTGMYGYVPSESLDNCNVACRRSMSQGTISGEAAMACLENCSACFQ
jgi:hypothetical protein